MGVGSVDERLRLREVQFVFHEVVEFGFVAGDQGESGGNRLVKIIIIEMLHRRLHERRVAGVEDWDLFVFGDKATRPLIKNKLIGIRLIRNLVLQVTLIGQAQLAHHRILSDNVLHISLGELRGVTLLKVCKDLLVHGGRFARLKGLYPFAEGADAAEAEVRIIEYFVLKCGIKPVQRNLVDGGLVVVAPVIEVVSEVPGLDVRRFESALNSRDGMECLDVVSATVADKLSPQAEDCKVWSILYHFVFAS